MNIDDKKLQIILAVFMLKLFLISVVVNWFNPGNDFSRVMLYAGIIALGLYSSVVIVLRPPRTTWQDELK